MNVFVTGVQGFVGRYFVAELLREDLSARVVGIGRSPRRDDVFTHRINLGGVTNVDAPLPAHVQKAFESSRYEYRELALDDAKGLVRALRDLRPDAVVHLASGLRDDDARHLVVTNIAGSVALIQAIAAANVDVRIVVAGSTGGVYGVPVTLPIDESAVCRPVDLYSATKLGAEHAVRVVAEAERVPVLWARLFNLVGPGQDERHVCGRFAAQAADIALGRAPPVIHAGNLGSTRDFIDVRDVATALSALVARGKAGEAYNIGSGVETRIDDVLRSTLRHAHIEQTVRLERLPPRPGDIPRHVADVRKLKTLGYAPAFDLDASIRDVVDYYLTATAARTS